MPNDLRSELQELIKEREALEIEAGAIRSFLLAPGPNGAPPPGLRGTPLVDDEGFPRADVDVYDVRSKRHRLACIDTDYALLMKRIEELVKQIHEEARAHAAVRPPAAAPETPVVQPPAPARMEMVEAEGEAGESAKAEAAGLAPYALIDQVFAGSPAAEAGVEEGDLLLKFGSVDRGNHENFQAVARVVQDSEGRPLRVLVRRKKAGPVVRLTLTPHAWSGRGLLGCHLSPLAS